MTVNIKATGVAASAEFIAMLEAKMLDPTLPAEEHMAVELMIVVARAALPHFDKLFSLAREDPTLAPMIMNASCKCAATILGSAAENLILVTPAAFEFILAQFTSDLAIALDMVVDDGAEPVAIADRPKAN